jgi:Domain of unknown function (DUF4192)
MQTTHDSPVKLHDTGDLIAAIPHLLGFKPTNSLVICAHSGTRQGKVALCLRADIPPPEHHQSLADQLKLPVLRSNASGITAFVVSEGSADPPQPLPHSDLIDIVHQVFASVGVLVYHSLWVPEIRKDAAWWCYGGWDCGGQVPDPMSSQLAAVSAASGVVTFESRAQMRASLEPVDLRPLPLLAQRIAATHVPESRAWQLLADVMAELREGTVTLDEDRIVDLAAALAHPRARDSCLTPEITAMGKRVEDFWIELTRALPAPARAESAFLLAVTAFLRGDGSLAGIALEAAMDANPGHTAARLLRDSMDLGLPPESVAESIARVFCDPPMQSTEPPG